MGCLNFKFWPNQKSSLSLTAFNCQLEWNFCIFFSGKMTSKHLTSEQHKDPNYQSGSKITLMADQTVPLREMVNVESWGGNRVLYYTAHKKLRVGHILTVVRLRTSYSKSSLNFFIPFSWMFSRYIVKRQNRTLFWYF